MNFLADESCAGPVLRALSEAGHDVVAIAEVARGVTDEQVLEPALGHVPHLRCSASYIPRTQRLRAGLKYGAPTALEEARILRSHPSLRAGLKYAAPPALEEARILPSHPSAYALG